MKDSGAVKIPVKNIYYMLCYAWSTLSQTDTIDVGSEKFDNIYNLLARVLISGVKNLLKRGFHREYASRKEELALVKGKIDLADSIKLQSLTRRKLVCVYDDFTDDVPFNQIIKFTILVLMRCKYLDQGLQFELKRLLPYFAQITECPPSLRNLDKLKFNRNNLHYKLLINVCGLIFNGLIVNETGTGMEFSDFIRDKQMASLYEKFVRNFYRVHLSQDNYSVAASQIQWDCDDNFDNIGTEFLPEMRTDITIENKHGNSQLIIDTKYYPEAFCKRNYGDAKKLISGNLYQIFTYVNNSRYEGSVSGMLLYPTVEAEMDYQYSIHGRIIAVKTLNLGADWPEIYDRLMELAAFL